MRFSPLTRPEPVADISRRRWGPRRSAFSLIEILIVVIIMCTMLAIAVPRWEGYWENTQLTSAQHHLRNLLLETRAMAMKLQTNCALEIQPSFDVVRSCDTTANPFRENPVHFGIGSDFALTDVQYAKCDAGAPCSPPASLSPTFAFDEHGRLNPIQYDTNLYDGLVFFLYHDEKVRNISLNRHGMIELGLTALDLDQPPDMAVLTAPEFGREWP